MPAIDVVRVGTMTVPISIRWLCRIAMAKVVVSKFIVIEVGLFDDSAKLAVAATINGALSKRNTVCG